ncbi:hypothetical protein VNO80_24785 [Phaseolus coccineus]|uniref:Uncharacterized protein n=1 Tax=Phaseolus coccineus TaxID=3886 RepID=A0AAN9LT21_PHACN
MWMNSRLCNKLVYSIFLFHYVLFLLYSASLDIKLVFKLKFCLYLQILLSFEANVLLGGIAFTAIVFPLILFSEMEGFSVGYLCITVKVW